MSETELRYNVAIEGLLGRGAIAEAVTLVEHARAQEARSATFWLLAAHAYCRQKDYSKCTDAVSRVERAGAANAQAASALRKAYHLDDFPAWQVAAQAGTEDALAAFLRDSPANAFAQDARLRLDRLRLSRAKTVAELGVFLRDNPTSPLRHEAELALMRRRNEAQQSLLKVVEFTWGYFTETHHVGPHLEVRKIAGTWTAWDRPPSDFSTMDRAEGTLVLRNTDSKPIVVEYSVSTYWANLGGTDEGRVDLPPLTTRAVAWRAPGYFICVFCPRPHPPRYKVTVVSANSAAR